LLRFARNDTRRHCHCEERSDEAISHGRQIRRHAHEQEHLAREWRAHPSGDKGFTLVELMVTLAVIAIALLVLIPLGNSFLFNYRFSAATNNFVNAVQLTRVMGIAPPFTMVVTKIEGTVGSKTLTVTVAPFTYTLQSDTAAVPFQQGGYVTLTGINDPDSINGNIYKLTTTNTAIIGTLVSGTKYQYAVSECSFECEGPVKWTDTATEKQTAMMTDKVTSCAKATNLNCFACHAGRAQVAASLHFTTWPTCPWCWADGCGVPAYAIQRNGSTIVCNYNPCYMQCQMWVLALASPSSSTWVWTKTSDPVVFDAGGFTRNHDTYRVDMVQTDKDGTPIPGPAVTFLVLPSGRIRLETRKWDQP